MRSDITAEMESTSPIDHRQHKKRQRLSLVCQNCKKRKIKCDKTKPNCSNCKKFGIQCSYNQLQWVSNNINYDHESPQVESESPENWEEKSKGELYNEIKQLRSQLDETPRNSFSRQAGSLSFNFTSHLQDHSENDSNGIFIDFYEPYNLLSMKNSSHEDHKPLNPMTLQKKDPYLSFFSCYLVLALQLNSEYVKDFLRGDWKSKNLGSASKWIAFLNTKDDDKDLRYSIERIVNDRSQLIKTNFFPFLTLQDSNDENIEYLKRQIQQVIPPKILGEKYLDVFFHFVWPVRPFIDEVQFKENLRRILSYDPETLKPSLLLTHRSDLAIISIFLIIIRYASVVIQLLDVDETPELLIELRSTPIPITTIATAQLCLSFYKVARKTTLEILQALLYLKCYFRDSPEDGDGSTLTQSQDLLGFIAQSAISMGLNRDPINYTQTTNNVQESNLRRKLWYSIVEIDDRAMILSGSLSVLPKKSLINVGFPVVLSIDALDIAQREELVKEAGIHDIYLSISNLINNIKEKTSLRDLLVLLRQAKRYIGSNYPLEQMISLKAMVCGSRHFVAGVFKNSKTFAKHIIQLTLEVQIHSSICTYAETNSHLNIDLYKVHYKEMLKCIKNIHDLTSSYLLGKLREYIDIAYNFELLPLIITALFRTFTIAITSLLRLYHVRDLFKSSAFEQKVDSDVIHKLIDALIKPASYMMELYKRKLAKRYNSALKVFSSCKYGFSALNTYKFQTMNKVVKFLESTNDDTSDSHLNFSEEKREEVKKKLQKEKSLIAVYSEWIELESTTRARGGSNNSRLNGNGPSPTAIININISNIFTKVDGSYVKELTDILSGPYTYCSDFLQLAESSPSDLLFTTINGDGSINSSFDISNDPITGLRSLETLSMLEGYTTDEQFFEEIFNSLNNNDPIFGDSSKFF